MIDNRMLIVDTLLEHVAADLDIPPAKYQQAVDRYSAVGRWLEAGSYPGLNAEPVIYPQGSFRLGTVVRPYRLDGESDYDIDLVCELGYRLADIRPRQIKNLVGQRLKDHGNYREMLDDEGRRCWTLLYAEADDIGFHLDVLPCVPNPNWNAPPHGELAIEITDRSADKAHYSWSKSNPKAYANWFAECQRVAFRHVVAIRKAELQQRNPRVFARVDDVPDQLVRTPLQRAIQILKRHRDVRFDGRDDELDKPISIIITTLAAAAYSQETDTFSALTNLLDRIQRFHDTGIIRCENEKWVIDNPVNPGENFADRWNDPESKKAEAFFRWVNWVQEDLDELLNAQTASELRRRLVTAFGDTVGNRVASAYSGPMPGGSQPPRSLFQRVARGLIRFDAPHRQLPRWHCVPPRYSASVSARFTRRGFRPRGFVSNSPSLPKHGTIDFEAVTNVPKPYKVFWQVVNTGAEARNANQLRGDFYDSDKSGKQREEGTAYTGMHWVECFIVKDDVCVARSGEFVVNIA
jgi:hypothetical protein